MKLSKTYASIAALVMTTLLASNAAAQSVSKADTKSETTVEDEYLSNIEDTIITELAASPDYDNKLYALAYLEEAINSGRASKDMINALDGLAGEGIKTISKTNNRTMNNFPDVRRKACELLGEIPSEESKNTLVSIALNDNEPTVLSAAIRSLGQIQINDGDEVSNAIAWAQKRNAALNPTSALAFEVIVAYEKLSDSVADKKAMIQSVTEIANNYRYNQQVRMKALQFLHNQAKGTSSSDYEK